MDFDMKRLMELSGIERGSDEAEVLSESVHVSEKPVSKKEVLTESSLRTMIREELAEIFEAMEEKKKIDGNSAGTADWIYGDKKPKISRPGQVTRGFRGVGFTNGN